MKAQYGDTIKIIKEVEGYNIGDLAVVDMRASDMGACDDDILATTDNLYLTDDEYEIVELGENSKRRNAKAYLNERLTYSDEKLLSAFKWGSVGESEFNKFINAVRLVIKDF